MARGRGGRGGGSRPPVKHSHGSDLLDIETAFKPKALPATDEQKTFMLSYLEVHKCLATGDFESAEGSLDYKRGWEKLQMALHNIKPGAEKTIVQWQQFWRDQRRQAKNAGSQAMDYVNKTGGGENDPRSYVSNFYLRVIELHGGWKRVVGHTNIIDPLEVENVNLKKKNSFSNGNSQLHADLGSEQSNRNAQSSKHQHGYGAPYEEHRSPYAQRDSYRSSYISPHHSRFHPYRMGTDASPSQEYRSSRHHVHEIESPGSQQIYNNNVVCNYNTYISPNKGFESRKRRLPFSQPPSHAPQHYALQGFPTQGYTPDKSRGYSPRQVPNKPRGYSPRQVADKPRGYSPRQVHHDYSPRHLGGYSQQRNIPFHNTPRSYSPQRRAPRDDTPRKPHGDSPIYVPFTPTKPPQVAREFTGCDRTPQKMQGEKADISPKPQGEHSIWIETQEAKGMVLSIDLTIDEILTALQATPSAGDPTVFCNALKNICLHLKDNIDRTDKLFSIMAGKDS